MSTVEVTSPTLAPVRAALAGIAGPVIVFNKSHSGSRLLAETIAAAGVFMGSRVNESWDSLDALELVDFLVRKYYPNYARLWDPERPPDAELIELTTRVFERHLDGYDSARGAPWGWKLCETGYVLPVLSYCFPSARFVHLIRDGRDVAFCDHKGPTDPFWRKIYFDTDRIRTWRGLRLTPSAYRRRSYLYNAIHWANSVSVGRGYGMMLGDRYLEVRYEDLCRDFEPTARRVLRFASAPDVEGAVRRIGPTVRASSIGKHLGRPRRELRRVVEIEKPLLLALGYLDEDPEPPRASVWHSALADGLADRWRRR